ncbi:MAG: sigma-70 family RNA polymerase sigma factor [Planctomycetota bacterium]
MDERLEQWVLTDGPRAVSYAWSLIRDRAVAEDLVQDALCALLRHRDRYDLVQDGTKLLFTAVTNKCRNWVTRRKPVVSLDAGPCDGTAWEVRDNRPDLDPAERAGAEELSGLIDRHLGELPAAQREVLHLSATGWEIADIASTLGITRNNARVLLHRARKAIAKALEPYMDEVTE